MVLKYNCFCLNNLTLEVYFEPDMVRIKLHKSLFQKQKMELREIKQLISL